MTNPSMAARLHAILRSVDASAATEIGDRLLARVAGRLIEETVEAAMACGLSVDGIWRHVADAVHNECIKAGKYPSEIATGRDSRAAISGELADCALVHDHLRLIAEITPEEVAADAAAKVAKLEAARDAGTLHVVDGLMYVRKRD